MTSEFLQVTLSLAAVLLLLLLLAWGLSRLRVLSGLHHGQRGLLKVQAQLVLGPRERVLLVQVAEEWVLLGVSPGKINHLHTLTAPPPPHGPASDPGSATGPVAFRAWLQTCMDARKRHHV